MFYVAYRTLLVMFCVLKFYFVDFYGMFTSSPTWRLKMHVLCKVGKKLAHNRGRPCFSDVRIGNVFYSWPEMAKCFFLSYLSSTSCKIDDWGVFRFIKGY